MSSHDCPLDAPLVVELSGHAGDGAGGLMGVYTAEGQLFNGAPKYRLRHVYRNNSHVYLYFSASQSCWYVGDLKCLQQGAGGILKGQLPASSAQHPVFARKSDQSTLSFKSPLAVHTWYVSASSGWVLDRHIALATPDKAVFTSQAMRPDSPRVLQATSKYSCGKNPFWSAPLMWRAPRHTSINRVANSESDSNVMDDDDDVWDRARSFRTPGQQRRRSSGVLGGEPCMKALLRQDLSGTSSACNNRNSCAVPHHSSPVVLQAAAAAAQRRQSPRSVHSGASRPRILTFDSASRNRVDPAFTSEDTIAQKFGFPSGDPALMDAVAKMEKHAAALASNIRQYGLRAMRGHSWQNVVKFQVVSVVMVRQQVQLGSVCPVKPPVRDLFIEIMRRVDPGAKAALADTDIPDSAEDDSFAWFKMKVHEFTDSLLETNVDASGPTPAVSSAEARGLYWTLLQSKLQEWKSIHAASTVVPPAAVVELLRYWASYVARDLGILHNMAAQEALLALTEHSFYPQISVLCRSYGLASGVSRYDTAYGAQLERVRLELAQRLFGTTDSRPRSEGSSLSTEQVGLPRFLQPSPRARSTVEGASNDVLLRTLQHYVSDMFPLSTATMASLDACCVPCECLRRVLAVVKYLIPQEAIKAADRKGSVPPKVFGADELWPILFAVSVVDGGPLRLQSTLWFVRLFTLNDLDATGGDYYLTTLQEAIVDNVLRQNPFNKLPMYDPESLLQFPKHLVDKALTFVEQYTSKLAQRHR